MLRPLKPWLPVVLWMGFIFVMSTGVGSYEHTSRFIGPLLKWLFPTATPGTLGLMHFILRKAGHFTEYAILALLTRRAVGSPCGPGQAGRALRLAAVAFVIASAYAATDELHQVFVAGRTASLGDVLIDMSGASAAVAAATLWQWRGARKNAAIPAKSLQSTGDELSS
jgi:VanZ family protein